jgi:hypothetical protein
VPAEAAEDAALQEETAMDEQAAAVVEQAYDGEYDTPVAGLDARQIYQPVPLHDDDGEFAVYNGQSSYVADPYTSGGYEGYGAEGYAAAGYGGEGNGGWGGEQQPVAAASYHEYGQQQGGWDAAQAYTGQASYDPNYPDNYPNYADPYGGQYTYETPPGGGWEGEQQPYIPQQTAEPEHEQSQYAADPHDPYRYQN